MSQTTTRTVLAACLCNAQHGAFAWDATGHDGRALWELHADRFLRELQAHEWVCIPLEEIDNASE